MSQRVFSVIEDESASFTSWLKHLSIISNFQSSSPAIDRSSGHRERLISLERKERIIFQLYKFTCRWSTASRGKRIYSSRYCHATSIKDNKDKIISNLRGCKDVVVFSELSKDKRVVESYRPDRSNTRKRRGANTGGRARHGTASQPASQPAIDESRLPTGTTPANRCQLRSMIAKRRCVTRRCSRLMCREPSRQRVQSLYSFSARWWIKIIFLCIIRIFKISRENRSRNSQTYILKDNW